MMQSNFGRSNINNYFYQIAKEYKKINKNNPCAELVLVGGAKT